MNLKLFLSNQDVFIMTHLKHPFAKEHRLHVTDVLTFHRSTSMKIEWTNLELLLQLQISYCKIGNGQLEVMSTNRCEAKQIKTK